MHKVLDVIGIVLLHADLQQQISLSSTPCPKVTVVETILDVKSWVMPSLDDVHGHSAPHCYKFVRTSDDDTPQVLTYFRLWSNNAWCETDDALRQLKVKKINPNAVLNNRL